jgi:TfoX/Sxy family transcriptional regulator of competence genes
MPYYNESESQQLREQFEDIVLQWPDVTKKKMFGSPTYSARGRIFAMLVNGGIILSQLDDEKKEALLSGPDAEYFVAHGRVIKKWVLIRIQNSADIEQFISFIEASYAAAAGGKERKE